MTRYQSWLEQVEEGQESLKDSEAPEFEPVPDNPPGLWERKDGKDASVANSDAGQDGKDWVTRISRKEHEKVTVKPWPKCQDLDVWRSNVVQAVCVASGDPDTAAWRRWLSPALLPSPDYAELADSGEFRFQSIDLQVVHCLTEHGRLRWRDGIGGQGSDQTEESSSGKRREFS